MLAALAPRRGASIVALAMLSTALSRGALASTVPAKFFSASPPATSGRLAFYHLGVGDSLRVITFDEPSLSGSFSVNPNGAIAFPLIGDVEALNRTPADIAREMTQRLADGYLKKPRVSVEVTSFRPVYILGEVNKPGEYPYAPGMTVISAVATANGFTYRADKAHVLIRGQNQIVQDRRPLLSTTLVRPGDVIQIPERYF